MRVCQIRSFHWWASVGVGAGNGRGRAGFLISLVACHLAGNSSCPSVYLCHLCVGGRWPPPPQHSPSSSTAQWFISEWQKAPQLFIIQIARCLQRIIRLFCFTQMWLHTRGPSGHTQTNLEGWGWGVPWPWKGLSFYGVRHDIMDGSRQRGNGYGWNQNEPTFVFASFLWGAFICKYTRKKRARLQDTR